MHTENILTLSRTIKESLKEPEGDMNNFLENVLQEENEKAYIVALKEALRSEEQAYIEVYVTLLMLHIRQQIDGDFFKTRKLTEVAETIHGETANTGIDKKSD